MKRRLLFCFLLVALLTLVFTGCAVINGIMTKINITITAATAEILNNTVADLKHRFPLPMLCMGKGCLCCGFICVL